MGTESKQARVLPTSGGLLVEALWPDRLLKNINNRNKNEKEKFGNCMEAGSTLWRGIGIP